MVPQQRSLLALLALCIVTLNNPGVAAQKIVCTYATKSSGQFCGTWGVEWSERTSWAYAKKKCDASETCAGFAWFNINGGEFNVNDAAHKVHWYQACITTKSSPNKHWNLIVKTCTEKSEPPSVTPTIAPTDWYAHPGHLTNFSSVQESVTALEQMIKTNQRVVMNMMQTINTRLDQVQLQADNLALESQSIINDVTQVNTSIRTALASVSQDVAAANTASSQLRAALIAATTNPDDSSYNCQDVDSCIPRIEAEASRLMFNVRGGKAVLNTDKCNSVDLCSVAKQSQDIFQALQNL